MRAIKAYWDRALDRLSELVGSSSYAYSVWHFASVLIIWGTWLVIPNDTFQSSASWAGMDSLGTELIWGVIAIVLGLSKIHLLFAKKIISLAVVSLATGYYWLIIGISFAISNTPSPTGLIIIMLGLYELWIYKRLSIRSRR